VAPITHFLTEQDAGDERLVFYRNLQDRRLREDSGRFVAESERVVRKLLGSSFDIESLLLTAPHLASLGPLLAVQRADFPVYVVPQSVMDRVVGFNVHRGCLAIARRPQNPVIPADARLIAVLVDLVDVDNLGSLARNAAAFGADALLLSPRCADPFYRKAVRTSAGTVFSLPIVRCSRWPDELLDLRDQRGFSLVGAALDDRATPLSAFVPPARTAVLFGAEGAGLDAATKNLCDALVTIPMAPGVDSLNVAAAGAVVFYQLTQGR
jgi:tRNA G18 (ribose-2'-O)-methylase SpoU